MAIPVVVREVRAEADQVVSLTLEAAKGAVLPAWSPGAHVELRLGHGLVRHYSLCGDPADRATLRIAVLRARDGRGGSEYVHRELREGSTVEVGTPRNNFALDDAARYLFVAGGIGITPILPMLGECTRRGRDWQLVYGGRSRSSMAFLGELDELGDRVQIVPADVTGLPDIGAAVASARPDRVYVCGPIALLDAVREVCRARGLGGAVRYELFTAPAGEADGAEFDVVLARSGTRVTVPAGLSILEAVREAGVDLNSDCEAGVCGTCELGVLAGEPDHRDHILDEAARAEGKRIHVCVSRSLSKELTLDV